MILQHLLIAVLLTSMARRSTSTNEIINADVYVSTMEGIEINAEILWMAKYKESVLVTTATQIWLLDPNTKSKELIAGSTEPGYADGVGKDAQFNTIVGMAIQMDTAVLSDSDNDCLRQVNFSTKAVTTIAGVCQSGGYKNGAADKAKFLGPTGLLNYESGVLIADTENRAIRYLDANDSVSTEAFGWPLIKPQYLIEMDDYIFITILTGVVKLDPKNEWASQVVAGEVAVFDYADGPFSNARFDEVMAQASPVPGLLLLAEISSHRIRILNFTSQVVSSICTGDNGTVDGQGDICTLGGPRSIMMYDDRTAYVSQGNVIRILNVVSFKPDDPQKFESDITPAVSGDAVEIKAPQALVAIGQNSRTTVKNSWCTTVNSAPGSHQSVGPVALLLTFSALYFLL